MSFAEMSQALTLVTQQQLRSGGTVVRAIQGISQG